MEVYVSNPQSFFPLKQVISMFLPHVEKLIKWYHTIIELRDKAHF